jgi:hypothetical protein
LRSTEDGKDQSQSIIIMLTVQQYPLRDLQYQRDQPESTSSRLANGALKKDLDGWTIGTSVATVGAGGEAVISFFIAGPGGA